MELTLTLTLYIDDPVAYAQTGLRESWGERYLATTLAAVPDSVHRRVMDSLIDAELPYTHVVKVERA
jgi:hypothetical protein